MPDGYRIEKDSLGEMKVPEDALYGAQTQRAVENFPISGQLFGRRFIEALGLIKKSAAETNAELGILDEKIAESVAIAAAEVAEGRWDNQFIVDIYQTGSGTSTNMNMNEVVACRDDVIPTAIHVSAKVSIEEELLPALEHLSAALTEKANLFDEIIKSGRTHLMDATPVRLGQEFSGYAAQVTKGIDRVRSASTELEELALGGTATGTGINTHPDFAKKVISRIADATGIAFREADDHFEAQGAKDAAVSLSGALNTVATSLMKIADDIRWLGSGPTSGIQELRLPAIQPGSSIMPGKVNPVMSEAMMMVCARVMGNHTTITIAGSRGNFELNVMMPVLAQSLLESITLIANISRTFTDRCLVGIEANPERAKELLEKNPAIATALNPYIGYDQAALVAKDATDRGLSVREIVLSKELLSEDKVTEALDVRSMTEPGLPEE